MKCLIKKLKYPNRIKNLNNSIYNSKNIMNKKIIPFIILITGFLNASSQIKLPKGFNCIPGENFAKESYFSDGKYAFKQKAWGQEGLNGLELINFLESNSDKKLKFNRTKDNLYWATGKLGDIYFYTVLVDEVFEYSLTSKLNGSQFSNYSTWMLQQIRNNIASESENYFTDFNGKKCYEVK